VKLRQLAGVKGKTSVSTPSKPRAVQPKTPSTSAKKRKVQQDETESDADEHLTEEDTPTAKRKSAQRGSSGRGRHLLGNTNGNAVGKGDHGQGNGATNGMGICVKKGEKLAPLSHRLGLHIASRFARLSGLCSKTLGTTFSDSFCRLRTRPSATTCTSNWLTQYRGDRQL
jgi:hypothetical protein